ncbi:MAG: hypothetical protein GY874_07910 [Desulfobacteraceae bacterium]|nr:hypothetical protein [Desulfobacteraceae bacterium]
METIAVYWEPQIKTYGIQVRTRLRLISLHLQTGAIPGHQLDFPAEAVRKDHRLMLVTGHIQADGCFHISMLFTGAGAAPVKDLLIPCQLEPANFNITAPVELIFFQGPHYADRYGIADAALYALESKQIDLLAAACSGSAIYLVLPEGKAQHARSALNDIFVVPLK